MDFVFLTHPTALQGVFLSRYLVVSYVYFTFDKNISHLMILTTMSEIFPAATYYTVDYFPCLLILYQEEKTNIIQILRQ